jgi:hypothetical protein
MPPGDEMTKPRSFSMHRMKHYAVVAIGVLWSFACEGSHTSLGPETESKSSEGNEETDSVNDDGGDKDLAAAGSCGQESGVKVEGEVRFDGDIPSGARLWVWFEAPEGGIPPCSQEIEPVEFPAPFVFTDVPSDLSWSLAAMLDVDGGYPPIPVVGDYVGRIDSEELDLSANVSDVSISLSPSEK